MFKLQVEIFSARSYLYYTFLLITRYTFPLESYRINIELIN